MSPLLTRHGDREQGAGSALGGETGGFSVLPPDEQPLVRIDSLDVRQCEG